MICRVFLSCRAHNLCRTHCVGEKMREGGYTIENGQMIKISEVLTMNEGINARETGNSIGWAVKELYNGRRVRRGGWNGKGMWLILVPRTSWYIYDLPPIHNEMEPHVRGQTDWVGMKTVNDELVPWLCSQSDLLAVDWELAEP